VAGGGGREFRCQEDWWAGKCRAGMEALRNLIVPGGDLFGIEWNIWKVVGWCGNAVFFSRFMVQWYATERLKQVVVPVVFWWLSLAGALLLFAYALFYRRDSVFIFAYAFTWIPYVRNLVIHRRYSRGHTNCPRCAIACPPQANYCMQCGTRLEASASGASPTTLQPQPRT
jgi:lipid-A-disaccharide synthase-like uncharacterized protein